MQGFWLVGLFAKKLLSSGSLPSYLSHVLVEVIITRQATIAIIVVQTIKQIIIFTKFHHKGISWPVD
jgi:hypothetical protein